VRKTLLVILFTSVCSLSFAQTASLKDAAGLLDKALTEKDTVALKQILHKDLTYGHSNGWVQTKADVINDMATGKMVYDTINTMDPSWTITGDVATMRSKTDATFRLDGKTGTLHLHVLQVWLKTNNGWQLLARQSTKL
jgi:ketosteroid isomerase-like protein